MCLLDQTGSSTCSYIKLPHIRSKTYTGVSKLLVQVYKTYEYTKVILLLPYLILLMDLGQK